MAISISQFPASPALNSSGPGGSSELDQDTVEISAAAQVRQLDEQGESVTQIAFKTGLDEPTVKIDLMI